MLVQCGMHKTIVISNIKVLVDEDIFDYLKDKTVSLNIKYKGSTYIYVMLPNKKDPVPLHRLVMGLLDKDGQCVDHINRNPLDNRKSNLRPCTQRQNSANRAKNTRFNDVTSKYKGVCKKSGSDKFEVSIRKNGKIIYLGRYENEIEAAKIYDKNAEEIHGEFAWLNFPKDGGSL